jgi:pyruvate-formate lyase
MQGYITRQPAPATARIALMRELVRDRVIAIDAERALNITESYRDRHGPTGVFNSELCFDHSHYLDGIALNLRIHPTALRSEEGATKVQYNVVSAEDMKAAQKDPAPYRDMVVRIAGFSAYFVELSPRMQNDIINRTENVL